MIKAREEREMKKIIVILSLVMMFNGCALDQELNSSEKEPGWQGPPPHECEEIFVTIDDDGNVFDLDGVFLCNINDV